MKDLKRRQREEEERTEQIIEAVAYQTGVSKRSALEALRDNDWDEELAMTQLLYGDA
jgi:NACalpha-BTF3-like transcription factor